MEEDDTIEPQGKDNGKTLNIICELCQSWGIQRKIEKLYSLFISKLSQKGYTINLKIKGTFYGRGEYYVFLDEIAPQNAIFTNSKEMYESSKCIYDRAIDANNVNRVIEFIESKI